MMLDDLGRPMHMGNIDSPIRMAWKVYGAFPQAPLVPRSEWKDLIGIDTGPDDPYLGYVHDQNGFGMCNASATCSALERRRSSQGLPFVSLSAGDLYMRICGGGDNGSTLEDGLTAATRDGVSSTEWVPYLDWRGENQGAAQSRKKFRADEVYLCPTFDHCFSAVLSGFDLISGVLWYQNYITDSQGWLPSQGRGSGGGHAVHGYKPTYRGDQFGIWHKNSWKRTWGMNGCCVFPETMYDRAIGGWWAVRSTVNEAGDFPSPR